MAFVMARGGKMAKQKDAISIKEIKRGQITVYIG